MITDGLPRSYLVKQDANFEGAKAISSETRSNNVSLIFSRTTMTLALLVKGVGAKMTQHSIFILLSC